MREYLFDDGEVDIKQLGAAFMPKESYVDAHSALPILCHDIFINYENGILLVRRKIYPAKDLLWPIGGRVKRGVKTEESLRQKVHEECGLELELIQELGDGKARTYFKTDPFGHGKGTDTLNLIYFGKGSGELNLNLLHEKPTIVKINDYTNEFKETLHPYVRDYMDLAIELL